MTPSAVSSAAYGYPLSPRLWVLWSAAITVLLGAAAVPMSYLIEAPLLCGDGGDGLLRTGLPDNLLAQLGFCAAQDGRRRSASALLGEAKRPSSRNTSRFFR